MPPFPWMMIATGLPPPTITSLAPDVGSAGGGSSPPTITGTNFIGVTSVKLNGVEHIGVVSSTTTTSIVLGSVLAGTMGAFTTVQVTAAGGVATYGDGATKGWTYLPAGYVHFRADIGITLASGSNISGWAHFGDYNPGHYSFTQSTDANQPVRVSSAINGLPALSSPSTTTAQFLQSVDTWSSAVGAGASWNGAGAGSADDGVTRHMFTVHQSPAHAAVFHDFGAAHSYFYPQNYTTGNVIDGQGWVTFTTGVTDHLTATAHLYEAVPRWHNYQSWRNGTLTINYTNTGAGVAFNDSGGMNPGNPCINHLIAIPTGAPGMTYVSELIWYRTQQTGSARTVIVTYLYGRYGLTGV